MASHVNNLSAMSVGMSTTRGMDQMPAQFTQKFITGKVIRLQAHVYVFVCSHCDAEFRSPISFLQHCELHYMPTSMMTPYHPPNYPSCSFQGQISPSSNRVSTGFGSATMPSLPSLPPFNSGFDNLTNDFQSRQQRWQQYNSMGPSNRPSSLDGVSAQSSQNVMQNSVVDHQQHVQPTEQQSQFIGMDGDVTEVPDDDIYEIYDLGYDESSVVAKSAEPKKKKRSKKKHSGSYICQFCSKPYSRRASLIRHYENTHKETPNESRPKSIA